MCPYCRKNAPIVYRGVAAYCTACGGPRWPLAAKSTNLAGQTSIVGGTVARVFGWIVLGLGLTLGLMLMGLLQAIFPAGFAGYAVGIPIALLGLGFGIALLRGGKSLAKTGMDEQKETRVQAIFSLSEHRGGIVTAQEVASAVGMPVAEADALLTELAKTHPDHAGVEIDDQGGVYYRVSARGLVRVQAFDDRVRVSSTATRPPAEEPAEVEGAQPPRRRAQR